MMSERLAPILRDATFVAFGAITDSVRAAKFYSVAEYPPRRLSQ